MCQSDVSMSGKPILTLNQFMRRGQVSSFCLKTTLIPSGQVLAQYRSFLRTARKLPGGERTEIENLVKYDFRWRAQWVEQQSQPDIS